MWSNRGMNSRSSLSRPLDSIATLSLSLYRQKNPTSSAPEPEPFYPDITSSTCVGGEKKMSRLNSNNKNNYNLPDPPPGAHPVQLELWRRVFQRRYRQIEALSPSIFNSFANAVSDYYKNSLSLPTSDSGSGSTQVMDLTRSHYSSLLLRPRNDDASADNDNNNGSDNSSAKQIAFHILALFYTAIDERMPPPERQVAIDTVKRAFSLLDTAMQDSDEGDADHVGKHSRDDGESAAKTPKKKHARKNPPPSVHTHANTLEQKEKTVTSPRHVGTDDEGGDTIVVVASDPASKQNESILRGADGGEMPSNRNCGKNDPEDPSLAQNEPEEANMAEMQIIDDGREDNNPDDDDAVEDEVEDVSKQAASCLTSNDEDKSTVEIIEIADEDAAAKPPQSGTSKDETQLQQQIAIETKSITPLPPPSVHSRPRHINFYADNIIRHDPKQTVSGSIYPRQPCTVVYDTGYHHLNFCATLDDETSLSINDRLARWDPYWKIVDVLCRRDTVTDIGEPTKVTTKTASCKDETGVKNPPSSCAVISVDLVKESRNSKFVAANNIEAGTKKEVWGVDWGNDTNGYKSGDRRLLLRTLPLTRSSEEENQRADNHLWPKGTFIQLKIGDETKEIVVKVSQRHQQEHDPTKWSGQCSALDLSPFVHNTDLPFDVKLCCREVIRKGEFPPFELGTEVVKEFNDGTGHIRPFRGVVDSYDAKEKLYKIVYEDDDWEELLRKELCEVLATKSGHEVEDPPTIGSFAIHVAICEYVDPDRLFDELIGKIPLQSLKSVKKKTVENLKRQTVSIVDCDDDNDKDESNSGCQIFSLLCPITKTMIQTPVRGRSCSHFQCFDLRNFLHLNKSPHAGRWKCGVCQRFLCCEDMVRCGLFDAMLEDLREEVSSTSHKVSFLADGSWSLMEQKKDSKRLHSNVSKEGRSEQPEVIELS